MVKSSTVASPPTYISWIALLLLLCLRGSLSIRRFHWTSFSRPFATASWQRQQHSLWKDASPPKSSLIARSFLQLSRGGSQEQYNDSTSISTSNTASASASASAGNKDEERYSRQVYTLGARAHGLVRSSTIYIDGPASSGLVYEIVKDLALSGVGNIILCCRSTDNLLDDQYHDASLDDLGNAYRRAAQEELKTTKNNYDDPKDGDDNNKPSEEQILAEYIRRLNPSVHVSQMERPMESTRKDDDSLLSNHCDSRRVLVSVDRPYQAQVNLNQLARNHGMAFVAVETAGVYGRVFCDFGPEFQVYDADGETPLVTPLDRLEVLSQEDKDNTGGGVMALHCIDTEKHDVSKGDKIQFQMSNGAMMPQKGTVVKVLTPHKVLVKVDDNDPLSDTSATQESISSKRTLRAFADLVNRRASAFSRVKIPTNVAFLPLDEVMQIFYNNGGGELFTPCDLDKSFDETRRTTIMSCFQALFSFVERRHCLPTKADLKDFLQQQALSSQNNCLSQWTTEQSTHIQNFVGCCAAKFTPIQAMFGAIAAQEALKAATGLYNPVKQILIYDCDEVLDEQKKVESTDASSSSKSKRKATGLAYVLGTSLETKVTSSKLFVVGAGAIGCELLKNLASMGFGTGKKGCISLTDMDTIEKSNLSRQLLFRDSNIGEFKSIAAQNAIHRFNPSTRVEVYTSKVGEESSGPFNENFWSYGVDVVLNALDNMEARLFMDQQCVSNEKALIDAGTLGSKGNVQVVVPHQSESYGSSIDPPEPAIPVCTLKNFPYAISHTIQWGRDLFDGLYQRRPRQVNDVAPSLASNAGATATLAQRLIQEMGEAAAIEAAKDLAEDINFAASQDRSAVRKVSIEWAVGLAARLFHDAIQDLLLAHPADSVDEDGEPFWTGSRKVPTPLLYIPSASETDAAAVASHHNLVDFVRSAGRLRMEMLLGTDSQSAISAEEAKQALEGIRGNKDDLCQQGGEDDTREAKVKIIGHLQSLPDGCPTFLHNVEFEKDDDSNGHVQFVNAASNLRAICYGIPPVSAMETRRVAGKIVPAMITTTAVVSALSCVELLKLLQVAPLTSHRNTFINLALPFFAFTVPVPVDEMPGPDGKMFTVWDSIVIKEKKKSEESKGLTLKRLIKKLKKAVSDTPQNIEVLSVSIGPYMIYASFLHEDDKTTLSKTIWELVEDAKSDEMDEDFAARLADLSSSAGDKTSDENKLELSVTVEDSKSGEEFLLPPVRVYRSLDNNTMAT